MTITTEQKGATLTMHIEGRLDTITSPEFEKEVDAIPAEINDLILDMKEDERERNHEADRCLRAGDGDPGNDRIR